MLCRALLLRLGSSTHAARRVALLIGNSQYQHENTLPNPVRDVRLLASTLKGMDLKTEVLENLEKRDMDLAIKRFVRESAGADSAILYFAGHGQQPSKGGRSYLLPVNVKVQDDDSREADGILAEDIASQLERLPRALKEPVRLVFKDTAKDVRTETKQ